MTNKIKKQPVRQRVFLENPFDIETVFESLSAATDKEKELLFMDRLIASIRSNPSAELTPICYEILHELNVIRLEKR